MQATHQERNVLESWADKSRHPVKSLRRCRGCSNTANSMQYLGLSKASSVCRKLGGRVHPSQLSILRPSTTPLSSSSSDGGEHDDYWTSVETEAKRTPAYQKAAGMGASEAKADDKVEWANPGGSDASQRPLRPAGEAYQPHGYRRNNTDFKDQGGRQQFEGGPPEPIFDMEDPKHISPIKLVDVRFYKSVHLVDIRQYTRNAEGAVIPTKKGISLTVAQYKRLKGAMADIEKELEMNGLNMGDP